MTLWGTGNPSRAHGSSEAHRKSPADFKRFRGPQPRGILCRSRFCAACRRSQRLHSQQNGLQSLAACFYWRRSGSNHRSYARNAGAVQESAASGVRLDGDIIEQAIKTPLRRRDQASSALGGTPRQAETRIGSKALQGINPRFYLPAFGYRLTDACAGIAAAEGRRKAEVSSLFALFRCKHTQGLMAEYVGG